LVFHGARSQGSLSSRCSRGPWVTGLGLSG
jgi:hypothetical protein